MRIFFLSCLMAMVIVAEMAYSQKIPPGVNPRDLANGSDLPFKRQDPSPSIATPTSVLAIAEAKYNVVNKELEEITREQGRLRGEMQGLYKAVYNPDHPFGTNDIAFAAMRKELREVEVRAKELREALQKRQEAMPEFKKLTTDMQDLSKKIQDYEKRRKVLYQERLYLVTTMNNLKGTTDLARLHVTYTAPAQTGTTINASMATNSAPVVSDK